jgi:hypothetical protein
VSDAFEVEEIFIGYLTNKFHRKRFKSRERSLLGTSRNLFSSVLLIVKKNAFQVQHLIFDVSGKSPKEKKNSLAVYAADGRKTTPLKNIKHKFKEHASERSHSEEGR